MLKGLRGFPLLLAAMIAIGSLGGLVATLMRLRSEAGNRRVEIGLEWDEVSRLAEIGQRPAADVLTDFKAQGVSALIIAEDTLAGLEQTGAVRPKHGFAANDSGTGTTVTVSDAATLQRILLAFTRHGVPLQLFATGAIPESGTHFVLEAGGATGPAMAGEPEGDYSPMSYADLRSMGLGLPPVAVDAANHTHLEIAARIANYPGAALANIHTVLLGLQLQGASLLICSGDDVLGYRGAEQATADLLRDPASKPRDEIQAAIPATRLAYGQVEFGKQRGDEEVSRFLHGDFIRVHAIQVGELAQMKEEDAVDRFAKAARERNIRFCYVRMWTMAGDDPVGENIRYVQKISRAIERGHWITGGGMEFGRARRFAETGVPRLLFGVIALGVAAGTVWMLRAFGPFPEAVQRLSLLALSVVCVLLALALGEFGRKLVALLAGIVYPTVACLLLFPRPGAGRDSDGETHDPLTSLRQAGRGLALASAITGIGILHVVGLLATRPFMVVANQFLGPKAQEAVPLAIVAFAALIGGVGLPHEKWTRFKGRVVSRLQIIYDEPVRYGLLVVGILALVAFVLLIARSGNDSGVGVSSAELEGRSLLDHVIGIRPRTKELLAHPAFFLALAFWWRGRRRWALPLFIVGTIGQISLLNTFCHIHTPLFISMWRDVIGLVAGAILGALLFLVLEWLLPSPPEPSRSGYANGTELPGRNL